MTQVLSHFRPSSSTWFTGLTSTIVILALVVGVVGGCDAVSVQSSEGPTEDAEATTEASDSFVKADLLFDPIDLAAGETFSIDLIDDQFEDYVARITHKELSGGQQVISANFNSIDPSSVTLRCRNQEKVIQKKDFSRRFTRLLKTANSKVATSDQEPDSYHYSTDGETTIVEVDYDVERKSTAAKGTTVQFNSGKEAMSCTHVGFVLEGITTAISADRIEFNGAVEEPTFRKRVFE